MFENELVWNKIAKLYLSFTLRLSTPLEMTTQGDKGIDRNYLLERGRRVMNVSITIESGKQPIKKIRQPDVSSCLIEYFMLLF